MGGGNESLQYLYYDPRPRYPFNYFAKNELPPLTQFLIRYSSIVGELEKSKGIVSGISQLRLERDKDFAAWMGKIASDYWETLDKANRIVRAAIKPKVCEKSIFVAVLQPTHPQGEKDKAVWAGLKSQLTDKDYILDYTGLEPDMKFTDIIHIDQESKKLVASRLATDILKKLNSECQNRH